MEEESTKINVLHLLNQKMVNDNQNQKSIKIKKLIHVDTNKRERNPGIELLRLLGMYAIIVSHVFGLAFKKYNYKELHLINISSFWHVGCYALIL